MKIVKILLFLIIGVYLSAVVAVYVMQRDLMFAPSVERVLPHDVGMNDIEEVTLTTSADEKLYSWYAHAKPEEPTLLFFHGNSRGVSHRLEKFQQFMELGYGVFMLGYPGYGGSEGSPSEEAFIDAAHLSFNYLRDSGIGASDIVIYGESLGTSVAVQLASKEESKAVVLEAPMSSIREIAQMQYPYLPVGMLLKDPFLTIEYIADVDMPLLVIHGSEDEAIPISSGQKLFELANEPKIFHTVEGAGHNNLSDYQLATIVHSFLEAPLAVAK